MQNKWQNIIGQTFGKLTVKQVWFDTAKKETRCIATCAECGNDKEFRLYALTSGRTKTCGCAHAKIDLNSLIGQRFNRLTILKAMREQRGKDTVEQIYVQCKCDCGNIIEARLSALKNNSIQSCGCLHKERITKPVDESIIGQRFGHLQIIAVERKNYEIIATCKCDCGNIKQIRYRMLKCNNILSCGCAKKPSVSRYNLDELVGQKYNRLEILSAYRNKNSEIRVKCRCDCGNEKDIRFRNLLSGETKSCGECNKINLNSLIGQKFHKLTILSAYRQNGKIMVKAKCDCGNEKEYIYHSLASGHTQSCGCNNLTAKGESKTRLYKIWKRMKRRCYDTNNNRYEYYGKRGIIVCDEWKNDFDAFKQWALANGYSDDLSIDRINNNGNYEPSNCRWATDIEQANNKSNNKYITINDETKTLAEWCRIYKMHPSSVGARIRNGWNPLKALTIPTK